MKVCLFSSYSDKPKIDNYIKFYLEMLKPHFDKVILLTNMRRLENDDISFLNKIDVTLKMVENEGYDFGMWYKGLQDLDINELEQLAFVNDSCILFNSLDKVMQFVNTCDYGYCGITDSNQISYHLQSYFTVAKGRKAIKAIHNYYNDKGVMVDDDVRDVIENYEIGLPNFLTKSGIKVGSLYKYSDYPKSPNICLMSAKDIIDKGCPLIKKKLIYKTFRDHELSFLHHHGFDLNFDYITQIKNKIYPYNISINYLLDV